MKMFCILLIICLPVLLTACGQQRAPAVPPVNIEMSVRIEPAVLAVGESTLIVTLTDDSSQPVDGALLRVHGSMDHAGMMPVNREVNSSTNGEYRVPFEWTMGGGWVVTVTAILPDMSGEISQTFEYFVEAVSSESIINHKREMDTVTVNIACEPDHNPAIAGDATVSITLTDGKNQPVTDAIVEVVADMSHPGMMPVSGTGEHVENGQYVVPLRWTMAGDWMVTIHVMLADGTRLEKTVEQTVILPKE